MPANPLLSRPLAPETEEVQPRGSSRPVQVKDGSAQQQSNFMPAGQLAAALARMQATPEGKDEGVALQRRYQSSLTDADLRKVGLLRLEEKGPSLGGRIKGLGGAALNLLDRPSQMIMQGMAGLTGTTDDNVLGGLWGGLSGRGERVNVQNAFGVDRGDERGGISGGILNFLGEVAFDPLTYMSLGTSAAAKSGVKLVAKEVGSATAEKVARRGFKGLDADELLKIRSIPALANNPKMLQKFERSAGGGIQLNIPFGARKKLIGGGTIRSGLVNARVVDATRSAAKIGGEAAQQGGTIQSLLRNNTFLSGTRDVFQTHRGLLKKFGARTTDDIVQTIARETAKGSHADDAVISSIRKISKETDKVFKKMDPTDAKVLNERILRSLDSGNTEALVAQLLSEGLTKHADLVNVLARSLQDVGELGTGLMRTLTKPGRTAIESIDGDYAKKFIKGIQEQGSGVTFLDVNKQARNLPGLEAGIDVFETNASQIVAQTVVKANRGTSLDDAVRGLANVADENGEAIARMNLNEIDHIRAAEADGLVRIDWGNERAWVPPEVQKALKKFEDAAIRDPKAGEKFVQFSDEVMNHWKVQATVALPFSMGFHARNMTGNLFLNYLAGVVNPKHYRNASKLQKIMKQADDAAHDASLKGPKTTPRSPKDPVPAILSEDEIAERSLLTTRQNAPYAKDGYTDYVDGDLTTMQPDALTGRFPQRFYRGDFSAKDQVRLQDLDAKANKAKGILDSSRRQLNKGYGDTFDDAWTAALKASGASAEDIKHIVTMREQGVIASSRIATDLDTGGLSKLGSSAPRSRTRMLAESGLQPDWSIKRGQAIGTHIENNARIAHYLSKVDEGYDVAGAVMSVKKHLFDYSDLTEIERKYFRRVMPFYTFMRKNTPLIFESAFTQPRKLTALPRLSEALSNTGQDEEYMEGNRPVPNWIRESGGLFVPDFIQGVLGMDEDNALLGALDMPTAAAFDAVEPFIEAATMVPGVKSLLPEGLAPEERNRGFRSLMGLPGGGLTELAKFAVETGTGQDLFTGQEIKNESDSEFLTRLATSVMPFGAKLNGMTTKLGAESNDRLTAALVRTLIGLNLQVVDPQRERSETYRQLEVVQDALDALKQDIGSENVPTVASLRADGLIPPSQQLGR